MGEMKRIQITVLGNPKALKRHRHIKSGHTYDPSKADKQDIAVVIQQQAPDILPQGPVTLDLWFYMPIPKSWPKYRKAKAEKEIVPHAIRPDLSNLVKLVEDAANSILYADDKQIVRIRTSKHYSLKPRTEIIMNWSFDNEHTIN